MLAPGNFVQGCQTKFGHTLTRDVETLFQKGQNLIMRKGQRATSPSDNFLP